MTISINNQLGVELTGKDMKEIKKLITGIKNNKHVPILDNLEFTISNEQLEVTVTNHDFSVTKLFYPVVTEQEGSFLVPFNTIKKLKEIKNGDVFSFNLLEDNKLEYNRNGMKQVLNIPDVEEYPKDDNSKMEYISSATYEDILKLNTALTSIAQMETRPILQTVVIRNNQIVSTDSHRLFKTNTSITHDNDLKFNEIGIKKLKVVFDKNYSIDVWANQYYVEFSNDNGLVKIKQKEGNFPDVNRLIPEYEKTSFTIQDARAFQNIIDEAATITKSDRNNVIRFNLIGDQLTVTASNEAVGTFEATLTVDNKQGEDLKLAMSGKYVYEALKQVDSNAIEMKFNGAMRPFTINPVGEENPLALVLPIRTF